MSYEANYNTAQTYLKAGLKDRAEESLLKALADVPENEKNGENSVYLGILALLVRIKFEKGRSREAVKYIDEGLALKNDHSDLLFFKALYLWEEKRYDEMFGALISYLVSTLSPAGNYGYGYTGEAAMEEIFGKLLPDAYQKSLKRKEMIDIIRRLSEKTHSELIRRAYDLMLKIDEEMGSAADANSHKE